MSTTDQTSLDRLKAARTKREPKTRKPIAKVSDKKKAELAEEKEDRAAKEAFYRACRRRMTGTCQCGCGQPSQKNSDEHFRGSCAHLFPKRDFRSIKYHPANWVERAQFGGCHTNMDEGGMDKWPNMADWEDIKQRFFVLEPLLTDEEKTRKFYHRLKGLIENN